MSGACLKYVAFGDLHLDHSVTGKTKEGVPIRVLDVYQNLVDLVSFSIENKVDYVLFTGDMYRTNHPSQTYKAMVQKQIMRLSNNGIKTIMITGNHDTSRSSISEHALSEFKHLHIPNVYLVDSYELLVFDEIQIACIAWQLSETIPTFELIPNLPSVCIAHCTTWGDIPFWDNQSSELTLGQEFFIPLDYFNQFDQTILGHIHKPTFFEKAIYPGSCEQHTWGEVYDTPQGFIYFDGTIHHIPYKLRPRIKLDTLDGLPVVDPNAMYRVYDDDTPNIENHFRDAFSVEVIKRSRKVERQFKTVLDKDRSDTEWIELYFDEVNEEFDDATRDLWFGLLSNS